MLQTYQNLRIFISSPGDVGEERDMTEEVIRKINATCKQTLGISLEVFRWENQPPNTSERGIQAVLDEEVKNCNAFILILYKRYGNIEEGHTKSNTEREIEIALDLLQKKKQITFLSYFRDIPENRDVGEQEKQVNDLKDRLKKNQVWFRTYPSPDKFKELLTHDLYNTVLKYRISTSKHKALRAFWQLGINNRDDHPRLVIIYPPLNRAYMMQENPDRIWLKRLAPHVVFEDFKALQKLEKGLRLIGFSDFRFYSNSSIPSDFLDINRAWICVPRNKRAQQQLEHYKDLAKFNFKARSPHSEAKLLWRRDINHKFFEIQSPLTTYLRLQRQSQPGGEWTQSLGKIIAKDFAVISRFSDQRNSGIMAEGTLKDYFIAGIRGLGTWGAGWFIDRNYHAFKEFHHEDRDIQILLEVSYRDERIVSVRDVSNEDADYFCKQNEQREIKKLIAEYREGL